MLQNQIQQTAGALRFNPETGSHDQALTEDFVANSPVKQKEIEQFRSSFFSDSTFDISWLDIPTLNADEKLFFNVMVNANEDVIRVFPVLHCLNNL